MGERPIVVGGGPAGLSAAWEFARRGLSPLVIEREDSVGGLARTATFAGCRFDLGGHRFYTKWPEVEAFWRESLGDDYLRRPRLSRILFRGRYFPYPLALRETLYQLGPWESLRVAGSFAAARLRPARPVATFEDWVTHEFGDRLYRTFFKTYTEKVWGISCTELSAEWASERLRGISGWSLLRRAFGHGATPRSMIQAFDYPRFGPGQMWEAVRDRVRRAGGEVVTGAAVTSVHHDGCRVHRVDYDHEGTCRSVEASHVVSTTSLQEAVRLFSPALSADVVSAGGDLRYRAFLTVCVVTRRRDVFPDNWIYVHDPQVRVGRIQNFKNWSPDMVEGPDATTLGLEYFCDEDDALWRESDLDLVKRAGVELETIGLLRADEVEAGMVIRVPKAYPVYDASYGASVRRIREAFSAFDNFATCGRNGMHRYNNQDHSVLTAFAAVRRLVGESAVDPWTIGHDGKYLEES